MGAENLPRGVALQWARWGRHPDYIFSQLVLAACGSPLAQLADIHHSLITAQG